MGNNPISTVDPDGALAWPPRYCAAAIPKFIQPANISIGLIRILQTIAPGILGGIAAAIPYVHANSKISPNENYVYSIIRYKAGTNPNFEDPNSYEVLKYGISSDQGYRVKSQSARLQNDPNYGGPTYVVAHRIHVSGVNRILALNIERSLVTFHKLTRGRVPRLNKRPNPYDLPDEIDYSSMEILNFGSHTQY